MGAMYFGLIALLVFAMRIAHHQIDSRPPQHRAARTIACR
jgi:hypothetical protein